MTYLLDVSRATAADPAPRRQTFFFATDDVAATVATALRALNEDPDLRDAEGNPAAPIAWECACLQRKCGACAMLVNGVPRLACDARLAELAGRRNKPVRLDPLAKFPLMADLRVDRAAVFDRLRALGAWHETSVDLPTRPQRNADAYEASRCLQCGCCLEVCPNFAAEGAFGGMAAMAPLARLLAEDKGTPDRARVAAAYRDGVFGGCGKSLACRNVCPAGIDLGHLMSRSNAADLWRLG